jgi:DNA topoisomerase I
MLKQLIHNGVLVPEPPPYQELVLTVRGEPVPLTAKQEEMALAWARKQGTPYVEDPTFVENFLADWSRALGVDPPLKEEEVDFGPALRSVEAERQAKARLAQQYSSAEERKALAAERRAQREALKERYGFAIVNGKRVELSNYVVEPSGIFMGRGQHPLRGRWKEGAREEEITLNLSPDAPQPPGNWGEILWQPDSLWVARWYDKLSDKLKYVWLGDTAPIKQRRDVGKFDRAHDLHAELETVRAQIRQDLAHPEPKKRMIATACYLIDALCLRVGDEKERDEADTVGATTLRPEHVTLHPGGIAEFRFLGKDSVLWHKKLELPPMVRHNLEGLIQNARPSNSAGNGHPTRDKPQIFPAISSRNVNAYLSDIVPGLTAKVFRTHHATMAVRDRLTASGVKASDAEHKKWEAASLANLEAAILCNHTRQEPAGWSRSRERYQERQNKAEARVRRYREQVEGHLLALADLKESSPSVTSAPPEGQQKPRSSQARKLAAAERRLERAREMLRRAEIALDKTRVQASIAAQKRTWNLGTSLKSYIDPRIYHRWGQEVGYDVLESYYPQALRHRFAWAREPSWEGEGVTEGRDSEEG